MGIVQRHVAISRNCVVTTTTPYANRGTHQIDGPTTALWLRGVSLVLLLWFSLPGIAVADILYKIIDGSGKVTYSDHAPIAARSVEVLKVTRNRAVAGTKQAAASNMPPVAGWSAPSADAVIVPVATPPISNPPTSGVPSSSNPTSGMSSPSSGKGGGSRGVSGSSLNGTVEVNTAAMTLSPSVAAPTTTSPAAATGGTRAPASAPSSVPVPVPVPVALPVPVPVPAVVPFQSDFITGVATHAGPNFNLDYLYVPRFAQLKISSFRVELSWSWIEQGKGQYTFNTDPYPSRDTLRYEDDMLRNAHLTGISPLIVLGYGNKFYDGGGFPLTDDAQAAFVNYASFVARRYKGVVKYYELWNEPDIGLGVSPRAPILPADYARLLKKVYLVLKAIDPDIVLIAGATAGPNPAWAQKMLAAGGISAMDGYSIHPYDQQDGPEKALASLASLETILKSAAGGREIPIYVTELGWHTALVDGAVAPSTQADYVARLYLAAPMYSFIKGVWWFELRDYAAGGPANVHAHYGLYDSSFEPKAAACAMGDVAGLIRAYRPVSLVSDARGVWVAKFSDGTHSVFAVWTQSPNATVSATVSTSSPSGARISARGICRDLVVQGNGSTLVHALISNSPIIFTTVADNISVQ